MNKAKNILLAILLSFPLSLAAQLEDATVLLGNAIKKIEADAAVLMAFDYTVTSPDGSLIDGGDGSFKLDGNKYSLLLDAMKLWCDGTTQWSYMAQVDEVYIAHADSDEARVYNPAYLMGLYRDGYKCSLARNGGKVLVDMVAGSADQDIDKVRLVIDLETLRPLSMTVSMNGQAAVDVVIKNYKPKCNFDNRVYMCPMEDFPTAEIVDMR